MLFPSCVACAGTSGLHECPHLPAPLRLLGRLRRALANEDPHLAIEVSDTTLQWLLAAFSHLEAARELLAPYREGR